MKDGTQSRVAKSRAPSVISRFRDQEKRNHVRWHLKRLSLSIAHYPLKRACGWSSRRGSVINESD